MFFLTRISVIPACDGTWNGRYSRVFPFTSVNIRNISTDGARILGVGRSDDAGSAWKIRVAAPSEIRRAAIVVQCGAVWCSVVQCVVQCGAVCGAVWCSVVVQCGAVWCSVWYSVVQYGAVWCSVCSVWCSVVQCVVQCGELAYTHREYNILKHTYKWNLFSYLTLPPFPPIYICQWCF